MVNTKEMELPNNLKRRNTSNSNHLQTQCLKERPICHLMETYRLLILKKCRTTNSHILHLKLWICSERRKRECQVYGTKMMLINSFKL